MSTDAGIPMRPQPLLLPQNRKLRHLRGIYLRNLSFQRPRGRTIDDVAIVNKSATKPLLDPGSAQLHHSASSGSLRPPKARRRSTNLAQASPISRQKKLDYTVDSRVADVFFSLHVDDGLEPVYISELAERSTNFNFRLFDLADLADRDPAITRACQFTLKIWARRQQSWSLLIEEYVDLRLLNFLGSLQNLHLPPNCVIFHLADGIYALELSNKVPPPKKLPSLATSSYNALMRLATLDSSIQDALATRESLTAQINELLENLPSNNVPEAEDRVQLATRYLVLQRRAIRSAQRRRDELRESITLRREAIQQGREAQQKAEADVDNARHQLAASRELTAKTREQIRGQRRRICEDLSNIFQLNQLPLGPPLAFQICNIPLPNSTYDPTTSLKASFASTEDSISAALGLVAQLTNVLQYYLGVPLPYQITPFGSRSWIQDDVSVLPDPKRDFPLYVPRGGSAAQYRFDYAWFLLNKDIEALCVAQGLKVVDIRHTLPNLKYLLYVCSAGTDEVPERKRGGVRGLFAGRLRSRGGGGGGGGFVPDDASSAGGSRRGSTDSDLQRQLRDELHRAAKENGHADETGAEGAAGTAGAGLPFDERETLTLRTKGLRENVVR